MYSILRTAFELFINLYQGIIIVMFCYKFLGGKFDKRKNIIFAIFAIIVMFIGITVQNYLSVTFSLSEVLLYCIIMFSYTFICLKGKIYLKILTPLFAYAVVAAVGLAVTCLSMAVYNMKREAIILGDHYVRYYMMIIANISITLILSLILKFQKSKINLKSYSDLFIFLVLPVLGLVVNFLSFFVSTNESISKYELFMLAAVSILTFIINIIVLNVMVKVSKNSELKAQNLVMQKEQKYYYDEIKNSNEYIHQISTIKHDLKNKVLCIEELIKKEEYDKAIAICNSTSESLIAAEIFRTENIYLNSILNVVHKKASECKIDLKVEIKSELLKIKGEDIITVVGNLCDNAIEYLSDKQVKKMFVRFDKKGAYYIITVKNSIEQSVLSDNPNLITVKEDKVFHGNGIPSVKKIAEYYNGCTNFIEKDNMFISKIMLEIPNIT